ncbi:MAG: hypothetical protein NVV59_12185 [Chitinophagaceae bacterium]|nr:hypothetical protein [Chitinophagaceae bacterium]
MLQIAFSPLGLPAFSKPAFRVARVSLPFRLPVAAKCFQADTPEKIATTGSVPNCFQSFRVESFFVLGKAENAFK